MSKRPILRWCLTGTVLAALVGQSGDAVATADIILVGGVVVTLAGPDNTDLADAVAIIGDRITAVGTNADIRALTGPDTEIIDLNGRTVLPGFIDAHGHFPSSGIIDRFFVDLNSPPIGSIKTIDDMIARLAERAAATPPGQWIQGRGYDDTLVKEMRHPTRWDLDRASTEHPIVWKSPSPTNT